jgi:hypothetical protein
VGPRHCYEPVRKANQGLFGAMPLLFPPPNHLIFPCQLILDRFRPRLISRVAIHDGLIDQPANLLAVGGVRSPPTAIRRSLIDFTDSSLATIAPFP